MTIMHTRKRARSASNTNAGFCAPEFGLSTSDSARKLEVAANSGAKLTVF